MYIPAMMSPWRTICFTLCTDRPFIFILEHKSLNLTSISLKGLHSYRHFKFIRRFYTESSNQLTNKSIILDNYVTEKLGN